MSGFFQGDTSDDKSARNASGPSMDPVSGVFDQAKGVLAGVESMQKGAEQMVNVAKSGGFRTDPEGVKKIVDSCDRMLDKMTGLQGTFWKLAQDPKLGTSPYAQQVSRHVRLSADGPQGVLTQLETFMQTLTALKEALFRASGQYAEAEETAKMRGVEST